ncbi:hypothetical protein [Oceanobacillus luteolus]|uniref:Phosphatidylinositol kinase n=1 Tax=Oceanobacillus luteolus TaxID=1274358 RepID=A0ABW4HQQ9_9BACI
MNSDTMKMYEQCKKHMHSYVLVETVDGLSVDGILTGLDDEYVYMAVPNDAYPGDMNSMQGMSHYDRQFGCPFYGPFGYGPGFYGYGPFGVPRFRRLILPLAALTALTLLPWY